LGAFLERITSPEFVDVAPHFRRNGAASFVGIDLVRAAARRTDPWDARVLGLLNGLVPEQYESLLADAEPVVRELAAFFLGPFWRDAAEKRLQTAHELNRLRAEIELMQQRMPPPGALGKLRWLAGLVSRKLRKAG